jgi:hypothetical protein
MSKIIKRERGWFIVSSKYREASYGDVGGGWIWAHPYKTRAKARKFKKSNLERH